MNLYLLLIFFFLSQVSTTKFNLHFLKNAKEKQAICNDGTPGAFYIRKTFSNKWVIHLVGGWWCWDKSSCQTRKQNLPYLMSSSFLKPTKEENYGIFKEDKNENPSFFDANMITVHYCSSDGHSGDRVASEETFGNHFRGKKIIQSVFDDLIEIYGLKDNDEVLFTGCSAGGMGVSTNTNFAYEQIRKRNINLKFLAFSDAGHFVDFTPIDSNIDSMKMNMKKGIKLWNSQIDDNCKKINFKEPYLCLLNQYAIPHTRVRTLVWNAKFDSFQVGYNLGNFSFNYENPVYKRYALQFGEATKRSFKNFGSLHSVYSSSCTTHCVSVDENYYNMKLKGMSLRDAVEIWWRSNGNKMEIIDTCEGIDCSEVCPKWPIWPYKDQ
eukprot:gene7701-12167_t